MHEPTAAPIVVDDLNDVSINVGASETVINLFDHFDDPYTTGLVARFELSDASLAGGVTDVLLFDQADQGAPISVSNFVNYVEDDDYDSSIIHRSVPGFIVQGGGFTVIEDLSDPANAINLVPTDPPIQNEFSPNRSNIRGTIAFAKLGGDPDSATSQFFFNLDDNSANLDNQNGGFTVFGEVLGDEDLDVLDAIAALPTSDQSTLFNQSAFTDLPLNVDDPANPVIDDDDDLVRYQNISLRQLDELEFEVLSNSNPDLVTATILGDELVLDYQPNVEGSSDITIRATNLVGEVIEDQFTVSVGDSAPTTSGIEDVIVDEDSDDTIISLFDSFRDLEDGSPNLSYTILTNTNQDLFTSVEIDLETGELILDYAPNLSGEADITIEARDAADQAVETSFSVTVNPINDAPIGVADNAPNQGLFRVTSGDTLVIAPDEGVLSNDSDGDGDPLTANLVFGPGNGVLELSEDGSFTYTPEIGFTGIDRFGYTAFDGSLNSSLTEVNLQVEALPVPPADAILGADESEKLKGTKGADFLQGFEGDDKLRGRNGNDTIDGGFGDDDIKGHSGNDLIDAGFDNDRILAGKGNDTVFGGFGNDVIRGQKGNDLLIAGDGNDWIRGDSGDDTLNGGAGNDTLRGGKGNDTYVLQASGGFDLFEQFNVDRDVIALDDGLTFGALSFDSNGKYTSIFFDDELIAVVQQRGGGDLTNPSNFISQ